MKKFFLILLLQASAFGLVFGSDDAKNTKGSMASSLQNLAQEILSDLLKENGGANIPSLAILSLTTDDRDKNIEEHITTAFTEAMTNTHKVSIYERRNLDYIKKELHFQETGYVDQNYAIQIGKMAKVDFVCLGTIKDIGKQLLLSITIDNVETAKICAIRSAVITKDKYLKKQAQNDDEQRKSNRNLLCFAALGANVPINFSINSGSTISNNSFPFGISIHALASFTYLSFKGNIAWDFINFSNKTYVVFGGSISLGVAPIRNDFLFLGLYATAWFDKIENYTYTCYGGSGTVIFNLPKKWGVLINCDATYRVKENYGGSKTIPSPARFLNSCRVCPSIGISYNFLRR